MTTSGSRRCRGLRRQAPEIASSSLASRGVLYVHDFANDWRHHIFCDREADVDYPAFVDRERRRPPEDVDGAAGFMESLEAALDPLHEEHNEVVTAATPRRARAWTSSSASTSPIR